MHALDAPLARQPEPILAHWLRDPNSLTLRLKTQCRRFEVVLLQEWHGIARCDSRQWQLGEPLWQREVLLRLDGVAWVYALTEVPQSTLRDSDIDFQNLGRQPLGEALFTAPSMRQGPLQIEHYGPESRAVQIAASIGQTVSDGLWGRSRHFELSGRPLRVNEIFLPAAERALTLRRGG
ncbi:chorismate lyase [Ferrimonas pelagia]|uniref:Probable chorismate pyruvate-lyase n=2 Tax=Ferrimonas pelagia TaxID=1177826 RepID=A0ABP9F7J6_9GAMM